MNPAVAVSPCTARQFPLKEGVLFIGAQIVGALVVRMFVSQGLIDELGPCVNAGPIQESAVRLCAAFRVAKKNAPPNVE